MNECAKERTAMLERKEQNPDVVEVHRLLREAIRKLRECKMYASDSFCNLEFEKNIEAIIRGYYRPCYNP